MTHTLESFQCEWYEQQAHDTPDAHVAALPEVFQQNLDLFQQVQLLRSQVSQSREIASSARSTWARFKRDRDAHKLHHRRLAQEKNALLLALTRLRRIIAEQQPVLAQLRARYEAACKEKLLLRGEKHKLQAQALSLQNQLTQAKGEAVPPSLATLRSSHQVAAPTAASVAKLADAPEPVLPAIAPKSTLTAAHFATPAPQPLPPRPPLGSAVLSQHFRAHKLAATSLALSPLAPVLATAGEDHCWKLFSAGTGEVIMQGAGHTGWLSAVAFAPTGAHLATASADRSVKLWSLAEQRAVRKLQHTQPVWDAAYHPAGHCLVTAAADHCARLWDVESGQQLRVFRGHVDTVCKARWAHTSTELASLGGATALPQLSQVFLTAAADKTVSLWDARAGLCVQTLGGHRAALTNVDSCGGAVASCDASGQVKVWDLVAGAERSSLDIGRGRTVNVARFDPSGSCLVVGGESGRIEVINLLPASPSHSSTAPSLRGLQDKATAFAYGLAPEYAAATESLGELQTHEEVTVNDIIFGNGKIYGATSDGEVLVWEM